MLTLLFHLNNEPYAVDSNRIIEVIPLVNLKTLVQAPAYLCGIFDYRGTMVPVVDLCQLIHQRPSKKGFSTRIMLFYYQDTESDPTMTMTIQGQKIIGLMAEKITETRNMKTSDFITTGLDLSIPYLQDITTSENHMIQLIKVDELVRQSELKEIFLTTPERERLPC